MLAPSTGPLEEAGLNYSRYCSHIFRIGADTTVAVNGMEDAVIQTLGWWKNMAYLQYIKIPRDQLANYSRILAA